MKTILLVLVIQTLNLSIAHCATILLHNGKIHTEVGAPIQDWLFAKNGRVHSFGKGPIPTLDPDAEKVDLQGQEVFPSLTDAHAHITDMGREKFQIDLKGAKTPEEAVERIRAFLKNHSVPAPNAIIGNGWDQSDWPGQQFPSRETLDALTKNQPILLYRIDGHAAWVNTYALKESKIWNETVDPKGGKIIRGSDGLPTGVLIDNAMDPLDTFKSTETDNQIEQYILAAVQHAQSLGITGIHDAGANGKQIEAMRRILRKKRTSFRFYEMLSLNDKATFEKFLASGPEIDSEEGQLSVRAVKLFADGAMGSRGAAFREPYSDDPKNKGLLMMNEAEMIEEFKKIDQAGFQIAIHTIGSLANHLAINAMEKALGPKVSTKRPRLEHTQVLEKPDIARISRLGIIASMQPTHCTSDMKWVVDRIGKKRARYSYPWNSLQKANVHLAFGSDAPVELLNPWHGLFSSITRQTPNFEPKGGFFPEEKISLEDAYRAFSTGAAYARFSEGLLGKLSHGAWADFIVLEQNPFTLKPLEVRNLEVKQTWIAGKKVFEKKSQL